MVIAFDIETAPIPYNQLSAAQRRRYRKEYRAQSDRHPERSVTDLSVRARSFHPFLSFICCISLARVKAGKVSIKSFTCDDYEGESKMIAQFWEVAAKMPSPLWVSFNGKKFDCEHLMTRTLANDLTVKVPSILDQYPYSYTPHCDLATLWRNKWMRLIDVCDLANVQVPNSDIDGSEVWKHVGTDAVQNHCEKDAERTLRLFYELGQHHPQLHKLEAYDARDTPSPIETTPNQTGKTGSNMTDARRKKNQRFHIVGKNFYGDKWDELRPDIINRWIANEEGETEKASTNDLTDSQLESLTKFIEKRGETHGTYEQMMEHRKRKA